ncbi:helix-turn-helix transcriptional regulator [Leptospira santarosai]|uniref:Transcriptional regulator n=1 Tax=Leptospira santarosai TaxID=28183 RepID=A0AB73LVW8_9LEPT|nr:helix-turn-helix transcriptional regulator [Leptospira santarosai]ONF90888.1 transcriptional regulator [Leptospira santarosai]
MRNLIINRLKVVLVEKNRSSRWLAEQLRKDETTVSRWCTNISQPKLETLILIASLLDIDVRELLYPTKDKDK